MDIFDTEQAAALCGLQGQVIRRYVRLGILPSKKLGQTHYMITSEDLVRFLADHRAGKFDKRRKENKRQ